MAGLPILGLPAVPPVDGITYPPGWTFGESLVDVGAITFGRCDSLGVEWHVADLKGWDDTADVVGTVTQRPAGHGAYTGPQVYAARTLTLDGWIVARTLADRSAALQRLHRSIPIGAFVRIAVTDPSDPPVRYVTAQLDGQIKAARVGVNCHAIQIPILCPDPRKYGLNPDPISIGLPSYAGGLTLPQTPPWTLPVRISGGSGTATNDGDMNAPWKARIVGPIPTPRITCVTTGRFLAVDLELGDGDTLDIDSRDQTVLLNGTASRAGLITRGSTWWELPAAATAEIRLGATNVPSGGTPSLTFTALPAWA